jgi:hypothetical protein
MNTIDDDVKEDMTYSICRVILMWKWRLLQKVKNNASFKYVTYMCTVCCTYVYTFDFITVS